MDRHAARPRAARGRGFGGRGRGGVHGVERGVERGVEQDYQRSLPVAVALDGDALLAWAGNDQGLSPQHGAPLRLVVPRWYGMATVKWLRRIEVVTTAFDGPQMRAYRLRQTTDEPSTGCDVDAGRPAPAGRGVGLA